MFFPLFLFFIAAAPAAPAALARMLAAVSGGARLSRPFHALFMGAPHG